MLPSHFDYEFNSLRRDVLLEMTELLVCCNSITRLLSDLANRLCSVIPFNIISISLYEPATNKMKLHCWRGVGVEQVLHEIPIKASPSGWAWQNQSPLCIGNVHRETRVQTSCEGLCDTGICSYCVVPLITSKNCSGALGVGSIQEDLYSQRDLDFLQQTAKLVSLAIDNILSRNALHQEKERLQMLLEVNATLVSSLDVQKLFPSISEFIRDTVRHDLAFIALYEAATGSMRKYALDSGAGPDPFAMGETFPIEDCISGQAFLNGETQILDERNLQSRKSPVARKLLDRGLKAICCVPLISRMGCIGTASFGSKDETSFTPQNVVLLKQIGAQVAIALDNTRAYREIAELKDRLAQEKLYLQGEIKSVLNFEEIVGESPALQHVLEHVKTVAPNDATVLILGETGTGKELIARAIHRTSSRKEGSFIKLNCAAIPTGLLESELFGHEKGAFTGAVSQKIGRLELAHRGTIFLDEIGEIPLEMQPKLLRVLQDHEFERLGGTRTIRVDIRLIAATNRDLEKSIAEKQFRSDLFYRLNVFPIRMPALRERPGDIPMLVRYFVQMYAQRLNKTIDTISSETMEIIVKWSWPGNVRELENFIERSVILTQGPVLHAPLAELRQSAEERTNGDTLESFERQHIIRALKETGGVISGIHGAAIRLGLKRTTLQSMIQRMRIIPEEYQG